MPIHGQLPYTISVFLTHLLLLLNFHITSVLDLYWSLTFISDNNPTLPNNDSISGMYVGHPQGKLQAIYYRGYFGAQNLEEGHKMQEIMESFDDGYGLQIASEDDCYIPHFDETSNWSTVDIDAPYHLCSICELAIISDSENICSACTYVRAFIEDTPDSININ